MESDVTAIFAESEETRIEGQNFGTHDNEGNVRVSLSNENQIESKEQFSKWANICRICANSDDHIIPIFEAEGAEHDLCEKIHKHLPIRVSKDDTLPIQLCYHCAATILAWHELLEGCLSAEEQLLQMKITQSHKEPTEKNDDENSSEELVDDPEPMNTTKEPPRSIKQPGKEAEHSGSNEKPAKRSGVARVRKFENFLKKDTQEINAEKILPRGKRRELAVSNERSLSLRKPHIVTKLLNNVLSCDGCTRGFAGETSLKRHREICIKKLEKQENNIGENSRGPISLRSSSRGEEENSRSLPNYPCNRCDFTTESKHLLKVHAKKFHGETKERGRKKKQRNIDEDVVVKARMEANGRVYYHCKDCGKNLFSPYTFAWHVRIHTGERPFTCHLCGKQFRVNQGLARHLRETHDGVKNFSCDICSRNFSTKRNVEEHRRIHTGERPFVCNVCGKSFKQKASLFVHNRTHTDSFPFKCNYCNQGFRTRPPLILHLTKHTGEKPHVCDVCDRAFRIKHELKRHRLVHSDEKPWRCNDCGLGFRQKRYLVNHERTNHGSKATTNQ